MRIRDSGYMIDPADVRNVLHRIRTGGENARKSLVVAAKQTYEPIAYDICISILYGLSYDYMMRYSEIPIDRNSFYGYRRKVISIWAIMDKNQ